jgi:MFS family permease
MVTTLSRVTTLLLAVGILLIGHGLQLTLLPMYAQSAGWSTSAIGLTGSAYFLGFVVGCIFVPSVVVDVGHIRTFMVMAALATIALLAAALFVSLPTWILFRFVTGFALSGLYMVIESWLNEVSPAHHRGSVLAIYAMISLFGMAAGQMLLSLRSPLDVDLFLLGAVLLSIAIIPVGLTRIVSPEPPPAIRFALREVLRASPAAIVCATFAGLVIGAFWGLGPVLGRGFGLGPGRIGMMMSAGIVGGALAQLPVGRLSDRTDRRRVIGALMIAGAVFAVLGWLFADAADTVLFVVIFCIGAATMPVYSLCIAHASDYAEMSLVEVASSVLIVYSAGSIVGPVVVSGLMDRYGPRAFFAYTACCLAAASVWTVYRQVVKEREGASSHASILPKTTQVVAELSPEEDETAGARTCADAADGM